MLQNEGSLSFWCYVLWQEKGKGNVILMFMVRPNVGIAINTVHFPFSQNVVVLN